MARQMFPPSGKTPARRLAVDLPLGSLVGPGTWAEPEVEGVSGPGRFDPFPGLLLWSSHLWQGIGSLPLAGRGPTQRVPGCHQGWLSLFEVRSSKFRRTGGAIPDMAARPGEEISGGGGGSTLHVPCGGDWMQNGMVPDNPKLPCVPRAASCPTRPGRLGASWAFLERPGLAWWRSADGGPNGGAGDALRSRLG
jgi:hypothetical protein